MTAFDYTRARATADRLLTRFGRTATLRQTTVSGGDGWDPGSGTETVVDTSIICAVTDYAVAEVDGTLIQATDRRVFVSAQGVSVTPVPADVLIIGSGQLSIVNVRPLSPAGTTVLWEVQARA